MPIVNADGCAIYVEVDGPESAPALMLSNSLGTTLHMWDAQVAPFIQHFRLVRYDRRGHGRSGVPKGPYTMECLGQDVLAVLDALRTGQLVWAFYGRHGRSMAWRQGAGAYRAARAHEYVDLFCGQDDVERAPQARAREGRCGLRRGEHGALVHQGIPRALAESSGLDAGDIRGNSARRLSRLRGSGPRHGPARVAAEDQSPDARHSRQARSGNAARSQLGSGLTA